MIQKIKFKELLKPNETDSLIFPKAPKKGGQELEPFANSISVEPNSIARYFSGEILKGAIEQLLDDWTNHCLTFFDFRR